MSGGDISEWQQPGSVDYGSRDFWIIRASHGHTEDRHWREHFNRVVAAGKPLGLYHFSERGDPAGEAAFYRGLTGFLADDQVAYGHWLDVESGEDRHWVDGFRSAVRLRWVGVYSTISQFNGPLLAYQHFPLNWVADPGVTLAPGWTMPDMILRQTGIVDQVDADVRFAAQPYPPAWPGH